MDKIKIPEITQTQFRKILSGELIELIPAKEGYSIYIYPDGKHYKYINSDIIKYIDIEIFVLNWNTIMGLRERFIDKFDTKIIAKVAKIEMSLN